jgi:hypothetical protein
MCVCPASAAFVGSASFCFYLRAYAAVYAGCTACVVYDARMQDHIGMPYVVCRNNPDVYAGRAVVSIFCFLGACLSFGHCLSRYGVFLARFCCLADAQRLVQLRRCGWKAIAASSMLI